jgi:hypothetical protein
MDLIDWSCATCGRKANGRGAVHVVYAEIWRAEEEIARRAAQDSADAEQDHGFVRFNLTDVLVLSPRPAKWLVECGDCCGGCEDSFWIDLRQVQTLADLVRWTAELNSKTWFNATDWISFMASVVEPTAA